MTRKTIMLFAFAALLFAGCGKSDPTPDSEGYVNLSSDGTANCYIVSKAGLYKFTPVKGNDPSQKISGIDKIEVLWETFGTYVKPDVGDLIKTSGLKDGSIVFEYTGKRGNAVIAAKKGNTILWSWHIWCCGGSIPKGQVYNNSAGTAMDRNLGATSATPGDIECLGLLYQWGRKDPFMGLSGKLEKGVDTQAAYATKYSAFTYFESTSETGQIDYVVANPITFITIANNKLNGTRDWLYTKPGDPVDNTRWQEDVKTIYDPCPPGWRVPCGYNKDHFGLWHTALGVNTWQDPDTYDSSVMGVNFGATYRKLGKDAVIWYPLCGLIEFTGKVQDRSCSMCWSASSCAENAYCFELAASGKVCTISDASRARGLSVRCVAE